MTEKNRENVYGAIINAEDLGGVGEVQVQVHMIPSEVSPSEHLLTWRAASFLEGFLQMVEATLSADARKGVAVKGTLKVEIQVDKLDKRLLEPEAVGRGAEN